MHVLLVAKYSKMTFTSSGAISKTSIWNLLTSNVDWVNDIQITKY